MALTAPMGPGAAFKGRGRDERANREAGPAGLAKRSAGSKRTFRLMIDETLLASLGAIDKEADALLTQALGKRPAAEEDTGYMDSMLGEVVKELTPGKLIKGKVAGFAGEDVVV